MEWALEKVEHDRHSAIRFVKQLFPRDPEAQACHNATNEGIAKLLVEAYGQSEKGV